MQLRSNVMFVANSESARKHDCAALGGFLEIMRFARTPAKADVPAKRAAMALYGGSIS